MSGCDHPHIRLEARVRPQALKLLLLKDPEKFYLGARGEVADLVEEDAPAVCLFKPAHPSLGCSGECAFLVAEELTFEEGFRDGGTVDLDQGLSGAGARIMDRMGNQFLPCAALSTDKDSGLTRCHAADEAHHLLHLRASIDDVMKGIALLKPGPQFLILLDEGGPLYHLLEDEEKFIEIDGLGEVVESPLFHAGHSGLHRSIGGHHDHRKVRIEPSNLLERLKPIEFGHLIVEQNNIEGIPLEFPESFPAVSHRLDRESLLSQKALQEVPLRLLVFSNQYPGFFHNSS